MALGIRQESEYLGDDYWDWSLHLDGTAEELDRVEYVVYTLHSTFPRPVRRVQDRESNFQIQARGWGEFTIFVEVVFKDGERSELKHELELRYPQGGRAPA